VDEVITERAKYLSRIMFLISYQATADNADSATFHWKHLDKLAERENSDTSEHSTVALLPQGTIHPRTGNHS
jgi:hypothetical protein